MNVVELGQLLQQRDAETKTVEVALRDVSFLSGGVVEFEGLGSFPLPKEGREEFCRYLGIPANYLTKCDSDLQKANLNFMLEKKRVALDKKEEAAAIQCFLTTDFNGIDSIISFAPAPFQRYPAYKIFNEGIVAPLEEIHGGKEVSIESAQLHNGGFNFKLLIPGVEKEVRMGDIVKAGIDFGFADRSAYLPATGNILSLGSYMYRLICTNGAVSRECVGKKFFRGEEGFTLNRIASLVDNSARQLQGKLDYLQVLADRVVDDPLQWIRNISKEYAIGDRIQGKIWESYQVEPDPTEYGMINAVTRAANGETITPALRNRLQAFGGHLFTEERHRCSQCSSVLV